MPPIGGAKKFEQSNGKNGIEKSAMWELSRRKRSAFRALGAEQKMAI